MGILYKKHEKYPKNIYVREFKGMVDVSEIIASWEDLLNNKLITKHIKGIINDLTECELRMDMDSFHNLIVYLKGHDEFSKIKLAVISGDPKIIVFPTLGEQDAKGLKIKPFTTEEAAVEWIMEQV